MFVFTLSLFAGDSLTFDFALCMLGGERSLGFRPDALTFHLSLGVAFEPFRIGCVDLFSIVGDGIGEPQIIVVLQQEPIELLVARFGTERDFGGLITPVSPAFEYAYPERVFE